MEPITTWLERKTKKVLAEESLERQSITTSIGFVFTNFSYKGTEEIANRPIPLV
jgi:hypothetical protein